MELNNKFVKIWKSDYPMLKRIPDQTIGKVIRSIINPDEKIDEDSLTNDEYIFYQLLMRNDILSTKEDAAERQRKSREKRKQALSTQEEEKKPVDLKTKKEMERKEAAERAQITKKYKTENGN